MRDEVPITRTVILPQQRTAVATFSGRLADMIESAHESALYYVTGSLTWSDDTTPRTDSPVSFVWARSWAHEPSRPNGIAYRPSRIV